MQAALGIQSIVHPITMTTSAKKFFNPLHVHMIYRPSTWSMACMSAPAIKRATTISGSPILTAQCKAALPCSGQRSRAKPGRMLCVRQIVNCKMKEKANLTVRCLNVAITCYSDWILTNCSARSGNPSKILYPFRQQRVHDCQLVRVTMNMTITFSGTYNLKHQE
jgi:hypothetical protein